MFTVDKKMVFKMNLHSDTSLNPNLATRCRILNNGLYHPEQLVYCLKMGLTRRS
jgi:hypothetical protein